MSDRVRRIVGLSDKRRMPRLGKIRLGIKAKTAGGKEYPKDVDYFVLPADDYGKKIAARYGERPTELDVLFPVDDDAAIFPQALAWYGGGGLRCRGDGATALRTKGFLVVKDSSGAIIDDARGRVLDDDGNGSDADLIQIGCPCPLVDAKGACGEKAHLLVMLPEVSVGGVFQIDTGSINNIINLNSQLEYVRTMMGRIALVPLKLKRVAETITYTEPNGEQKKSTHYLLRLELPLNLRELVETRIAGPELALRRAAGIQLADLPDPTSFVATPPILAVEATHSSELEADAIEPEPSRPATAPHDDAPPLGVPGEVAVESTEEAVAGPAGEFPFPEPAKTPEPAAEPAKTKLTNEQLDRFVLAAAKLLGTPTSGGPVGALQAVEDKLKALNAPFSRVPLDDLSPEESRAAYQWITNHVKAKEGRP